MGESDQRNYAERMGKPDRMRDSSKGFGRVFVVSSGNRRTIPADTITFVAANANRILENPLFSSRPEAGRYSQTLLCPAGLPKISRGTGFRSCPTVDRVIMAKRRRKSTSQRRRVPARFAVGDRVRVRAGVTDPDSPDIPLGGWSSVVEEINRRGASPSYLIAWDQRSLEQMHPVYRKRCERDDLDPATMVLACGRGSALRAARKSCSSRRVSRSGSWRRRIGVAPTSASISAADCSIGAQAAAVNLQGDVQSAER